LESLQEVCAKVTTLTIFYSWQSDLSNRTTRGLIGAALDKAAKTIRSDKSLDVEPVIDRDTLDEPGAPDIASAIFDKIDRAEVFVADVSIVSRGSGRGVPNPNVLVEFGYALKAVGHKKVIAVINLHYGSIEELPFDLRGRRVLTYTLGPDETEVGEVRRQLEAKLVASLRTVLSSAVETEQRRRGSAFISRVLGDLVTVQVFGDEAPRREVNPWHDEVANRFAMCARNLRSAGTDACADELGFGAQMESLAARLDAVAQHHRSMGFGSWQEHLGLISSAVEEARALQAAMFVDAAVEEVSVRAVRAELEQSLRQLRSWIVRIESTEQVGRELFKEMVDASTAIGHRLASISYYPVPGVAEEGRATLRALGHDLHLLWSDYQMMHNAEKETFEKIKRAADLLPGILPQPS
jgi:hypothetical protein